MRNLCAVAAMVASSSANAMVCNVTDDPNDRIFYEVTGDLILQHWPSPTNPEATEVFQYWRCNTSKTRPDGEIQCVNDNMDDGAYSALSLLPDIGLVIMSYGNVNLDNHVIRVEPISCEENR